MKKKMGKGAYHKKHGKGSRKRVDRRDADAIRRGRLRGVKRKLHNALHALARVAG